MKDLLTIDEVAQIAKVSKPTVYRRVKNGDFPKPKKIKSEAKRGPKKVNRWDRAEVMGWLLKGNDPDWMKQPIKDIQETVEVDQAPKDYDPEPEPAAREPRSFWENHVLLAVVGGVLAAVMYQIFRG
jgi:predicted DNA-binding transcriptional regulator AlpA